MDGDGNGGGEFSWIIEAGRTGTTKKNEMKVSPFDEPRRVITVKGRMDHQKFGKILQEIKYENLFFFLFQTKRESSNAKG